MRPPRPVSSFRRPTTLAAAGAAAALALSLAGCAYEWQRPGSPPDQVRRDERECSEYARRKAPGRIGSQMHLEQRQVNGTTVKTYVGPPRSEVESQLFNECMKARGYHSRWK